MSSLFVNGNIVHGDIELIIFDKDGTLIDIHHYWSSMIKIRAKNITRRWFNDINCSEHEADLINLMGVDIETGKLKPEGPVGVKSREYIINLVKSYVCRYVKSVNNSDIELLFKNVDEITEKDLSSLLKILPGVEQLLRSAKELGVYTVVTSTDITSRAVKAMENLGLKTYFEEIIGGDAVKNTKPSPDLAKLALLKIGCKPGNSVVIGDHPVDILMGIGADIGVNIGVLNGISNKENFSQCNCILVDSLYDISMR